MIIGLLIGYTLGLVTCPVLYWLAQYRAYAKDEHINLRPLERRQMMNRRERDMHGYE